MLRELEGIEEADNTGELLCLTGTYDSNDSLHSLLYDLYSRHWSNQDLQRSILVIKKPYVEGHQP